MLRPVRTFYLITRVNAAVNARLERLLKPLDITVAQYTCMSRIRGHEVMSSAKLSRAHRVSPQTMYEMITNLEKRSLLVREKCPDNKRQLLVSLTRKGHQILDLCDRRVDEIEPELLAGLNTANHALFREFMQIVIENANRTEQRAVAVDPLPPRKVRKDANQSA
jgi:DNA-binding MarR family transcriptional regulator